MPYLLLAIGALVGIYGLYRFFLNADVKQIKALLLSVTALAIALALVIMTLTGRLAQALGLLVVLLPFAAPLLRKRKIADRTQEPPAPAAGPMTEKEALEVLGLEPGATAHEIDRAYKKLMVKLHPDSQGSDWMAAKLNQARDILTGK